MLNKNNKKIDINKLFTDLNKSKSENSKNNVSNKKYHKNFIFYHRFNGNKYNKDKILINVNNNSLFIKDDKYSK